MNKLQKVKEALEKAYDHHRIWVGDMTSNDDRWPPYLPDYEEALKELNKFMDRLESEELLEEVAQEIYDVVGMTEYDDPSLENLEYVYECKKVAKTDRDWETYP